MNAGGMQRYAEAETENYGSSAQKVSINAETSNGYIEVIK
jgi:predicted membrane protein